MSIFNPTTDAATNAANQLRSIVRQQFQQLSRSGVTGYNLIWKNPQATPQQVLATLGQDAAAIFQLAGLNIQTVADAAEICGINTPVIPEVPTQWVLSFNPDGSATVTSATSSSSSGS